MNFPQRKTNRLKDYNYSQEGHYFITMCSYQKYNIFGEIIDGMVELNKIGRIIDLHINKLNSLYNEICIDKHVIMPNHIHMIIMIENTDGLAKHSINKKNPSKMALAKVIQTFKSSITKDCRIQTNAGTHAMRSLQIWQRSYYDHIIRNHKEYEEIWEYIEENPQKWSLDQYYNKR